MRFLPGLLAATFLFVANGGARGVAADEPRLVFLDNDFLGPGGSNIQSLIPLLAAPRVRLLGIGVVTGDAWRQEEVQHLLRFLEIAGRTDISVHPGAEMPLLRTQREMAEWEGRFGRIAWKGAWNAPKTGRHYHPDDPALVPPMPEGAPAARPSDVDAATALVRAVRSHPHQVTIVAAGPLTDIALAVRIAPDIAALARGLVFMGGLVDTNMRQVTGNADYATDFNFLFDPEAAHIVLTAPWARITAVGDVSTGIVMTNEMADRIGRGDRPENRYVARFARRGQPFWDEITTAVAIDPSLIRQEVAVRMDVDLARGPDYGRAVLSRPDAASIPGSAPANAPVTHLVQSIDAERFLASFERWAAGGG
ncbi:nucleoside hydrolase [Rhizosaccharibacter radicis]|uniref:Nucleoside hydrolase n=1 Tax=Rhizosaccharibacter radicis TaxID=2782605 RepID=A0ABT1W317_9PROT|nr:nucleoside hydrolase [Acetobacteraceae bacterium KSS12]